MPPGPSHPPEPPCSPHGNKRKKGRKLRSRAEGGRSACGGAAANERTNERAASDGGGGHSRGKQFLLIQRSHPQRRSKSLVDPLLDFSPSRSSLFVPARVSLCLLRTRARDLRHLRSTCSPTPTEASFDHGYFTTPSASTDSIVLVRLAFFSN